jgi:hypothetical protein
LNQCNDFWNNKIESYNEQSGSLEMELRQKHEHKLEGYQEELDQKMRQVGKPSPEVLNLEYQIKRLVKDQRYKEAHALQKKCEDLVFYNKFNPQNRKTNVCRRLTALPTIGNSTR